MRCSASVAKARSMSLGMLAFRIESCTPSARATSDCSFNKASEKDLETLPGIDETAARRIVAERPYESGGELVKKHVISRAEYDRIADKIVAR